MSPEQQYVRELIGKLDALEPAAFELGTPVIVNTEETSAIISLGEKAVEPLIDALPSGSRKIIAYAAFCLGKIGDARALTPLEAIRRQYDQKMKKESDDYFVLGAVQSALDELNA